MNLFFIDTAIKAALAAGVEILSVYDEQLKVELKEDNSPLTIADTLSQKKIIKLLSSTGLPILSEEGKTISFDKRKSWKQFWMVDPLDGTKEFIKKNGEFTVNIALIDKEIPITGIVYAPVLKTLYYAAEDLGAYKCVITDEIINEMSAPDFLNTLIKHSERLPLQNPKKIFTVVASRSHLTPETEVFINDLKSKHSRVDFVSKGSSLKLCLVAEGIADIYPRLAPTMEWDTAAGHAIALYAGKSVTLFKSNQPMKYNKESLLNDWFVCR